MQDLKRCPFCGSSASVASEHKTYGHGDFGKQYFIACVNKACGARVLATSAYQDTDVEQIESAAANWNLRVT